MSNQPIPDEVLGNLLPNPRSVDWKKQTCGNCEFFVELQATEKMRITGGALGTPSIGDCREGPPIPIILGGNPQTGQINLQVMPSRLPVHYPACARFKLRTA